MATSPPGGVIPSLGCSKIGLLVVEAGDRGACFTRLHAYVLDREVGSYLVAEASRTTFAVEPEQNAVQPSMSCRRFSKKFVRR